MIFHYKSDLWSIKYKKIARSILVSKLYAIVYRFDIRAVLKSIIIPVLAQSVPMIFCIDLKSLYDCLGKLGTTQEKHLMANIICLQQLYARHEIIEIRLIDSDSNPADTMIMLKLCHAPQELIKINIVNMKTSG